LRLLGALMAFVAILSVMTLSVWHSGAFVDQHDPIHASVVEHDYQGGSKGDPDSPLHIAAHAVGQWIAAPDDAPAVKPAVSAALRWPVSAATFRAGIDPASLLRPPRG
jgi:hypothetical protein